jgi:hypothetical protein
MLAIVSTQPHTPLYVSSCWQLQCDSAAHELHSGETTHHVGCCQATFMACTQRPVDLLRHSVLLQPTSTNAVLLRPIVAHNCHSLYLPAQSSYQHTKTIQK